MSTRKAFKGDLQDGREGKAEPTQGRCCSLEEGEKIIVLVKNERTYQDHGT